MYIYKYINVCIYIIYSKYIYICNIHMCEQEECHWKKLYVSSFEIFYFYLNHKENKLQFFTEHLQTKHNLLYKNGGYRVAIQNGVTVRSMRVQTSWNLDPFLPDFCVPHVFKRKYCFYFIS